MVPACVSGSKFAVKLDRNDLVARCLQAGIQHFVWSGLEEVRDVPGLKDQLKEVGSGHYVPHFESKAAVTVRALRFPL